jgi:folate-dependent phosphoribosylglycinamide formyltransferase PurN
MKIGLLISGSLNKFRLKTLLPILADKQFEIKMAIVDKRPTKTLKQKFLKNYKRGRGGYMFIMAIEKLFSQKQKSIRIEEFCNENQIEIIETKTPYSVTIIDKVKKSNLDILILVGGFGIIKEVLLNTTPKGVLSYHHGNMRKYRGMPPALWELYNNEKEMGVTVQVLASGLDCGIPIEEKTIEIRKSDTLKKLQNRATEQSIDMLYKALKKLSDKDFVPEKIETFGKVYTLPNLKQWIILHIRLFLRILK